MGYLNVHKEELSNVSSLPITTWNSFQGNAIKPGRFTENVPPKMLENMIIVLDDDIRWIYKLKYATKQSLLSNTHFRGFIIE